MGHVAGDLGKRTPIDAVALLRRPYLHRDGVGTDLGAVPGASDNVSTTWDLNNHDEVVGTFYSLSASVHTPTHAYLYSDGAFTDLTTTVALPDGYSIVQALGINDPGQIIVTATRDPRGAGVYQTFLLTPVPGPGAAACAALGAAALLARRRRRR